jgi:hypothetical protein
MAQKFSEGIGSGAAPAEERCPGDEEWHPASGHETFMYFTTLFPALTARRERATLIF